MFIPAYSCRHLLINNHVFLVGLRFDVSEKLVEITAGPTCIRRVRTTIREAQVKITARRTCNQLDVQKNSFNWAFGWDIRLWLGNSQKVFCRFLDHSHIYFLLNYTFMSCFAFHALNNTQTGARERLRCCIFHYPSWTDNKTEPAMLYILVCLAVSIEPFLFSIIFVSG